MKGQEKISLKNWSMEQCEDEHYLNGGKWFFIWRWMDAFGIEVLSFDEVVSNGNWYQLFGGSIAIHYGSLLQHSTRSSIWFYWDDAHPLVVTRIYFLDWPNIMVKDPFSFSVITLLKKWRLKLLGARNTLKTSCNRSIF